MNLYKLEKHIKEKGIIIYTIQNAYIMNIMAVLLNNYSDY